MGVEIETAEAEGFGVGVGVGDADADGFSLGFAVGVDDGLIETTEEILDSGEGEGEIRKSESSICDSEITDSVGSKEAAGSIVSVGGTVKTVKKASAIAATFFILPFTKAESKFCQGSIGKISIETIIAITDEKLGKLLIPYRKKNIVTNQSIIAFIVFQMDFIFVLRAILLPLF